MFKRSLVVAQLMVVALGLALPSSQAGAADFPETGRIGEHNLVLNGMGTRKKALLPLYTAGLYLPQRSSQAGAIIRSDVPMAVRIEILSVFVSQQNMVSALREGLQKSTGGNTSPIANEIEQFQQCFADQIARGDIFDIAYHPSTGVMVFKNGQRKNTIRGLAFKQALFGIWLGDNPADAGLKRGMLGN